jgi:WD40 repeat protein
MLQGKNGPVAFRNITLREQGSRPDSGVSGADEGKGWVQLFNGKDLTGWKLPPGSKARWKVEDHLLVGSGGTGHLFSDRGDYENFHFRVEANISDGGNSGQYFRCDFGENRQGKWPWGYEAQINSTQKDPQKTGSLYGLVKITDMLIPPETWFTQEVIAKGNHILIKVNDRTVVDYVDEKNTYSKGHLALQQLDRDTVIRFRKIEIKELPSDPSVDEAWLKAVAAMPAATQVEAVATRLQELNPGFDGMVIHKVEGGVVTSLELLTDHVTDISPVRGLTGLRVLRCSGNWHKGQLADLSPLKDLKLTTLDCSCTKVSDLSPLTDMKLTTLDCRESRVSDLSPLKDMKLMDLRCGGTQVSALSPLKDMKPTRLSFYGTHVSDLSPLKEMNLTLLNCGHTQVSDLSPLKDMKLTDLLCNSTKVSDLSPLKGMQLTRLCCDKTNVADLSPLKGMPLVDLRCDFKPERDAEILRSIKTLETQQFWQEVDAKSLAKPLPSQPSDEIRRFEGSMGGVRSVAFSPDGRRAVSGAAEKVVRLWDVETGKELRHFQGHSLSIWSVAFSPDDRHIASGSEDYTVRLWDANTGQELKRLQHALWIQCVVVFSPDGRRVLSGSEDKTMRLWDVETGKEVRRFPHLHSVKSVAFSADGRLLLSGDNQGVVRLWDAEKAEELRRFDEPMGSVTSVGFFPDGQRAFSNATDGSNRLWNVESGQELRRFMPGASNMTLSRDGSRALSGSGNGTVGLWDVNSGRELHRFKGHKGGAWCVAFSPDGRWALSGGADKTIRLWKLPPADKDPKANEPPPTPAVVGP